MSTQRPILCIGSALWDIIAQAGAPMHPGADLPGRIGRQPGGVALNVARALAAQGLPVELLSAVGSDSAGEELVAASIASGVACSHLTRTGETTGTYLAVEDSTGELFAAVADCAGLERHAAAILAPLSDGRLGSGAAPWPGRIVIDGNLPPAALDGLVHDPAFRAAEIALVPASPGKAARLAGAMALPGGTLYVNLTEARVLCAAQVEDAAEAAVALVGRGATRAVVTSGAGPVALADAAGCVTAEPPVAAPVSTTGAGDVFLAAHIAAETRGLDRVDALEAAAATAATHISGG